MPITSGFHWCSPLATYKLDSLAVDDVLSQPGFLHCLGHTDGKTGCSLPTKLAIPLHEWSLFIPSFETKLTIGRTAPEFPMGPGSTMSSSCFLEQEAYTFRRSLLSLLLSVCNCYDPVNKKGDLCGANTSPRGLGLILGSDTTTQSTLAN